VTAADALPQYHHRERHSIAVDAPAGRALAAAREVRLEDMPVVRALVRLRGLPSRPGSLWDAMRGSSFRPRGDDTLVAVGRPWQLRGGMLVVDDFAAFAEPGYAKMAVDLRFVDGHLVTETRVFLTSTAAQRRFGAYWLAVRPFSGLTRRVWLRAAKRRAEQ
jgi:hypothetical protein